MPRPRKDKEGEWSHLDDVVIRRNQLRKAAKMLGVSIRAVKERRRELGLRKANYPEDPNDLIGAQYVYLLDNVAGMTCRRIANKYRVSKQAVSEAIKLYRERIERIERSNHVSDGK